MVTNVVGLVAAVLGDKYYWWIDPVGAIVLAVYTISNWTGTVLENAGNNLNSSSLRSYKTLLVQSTQENEQFSLLEPWA